MIVTKVVCVSDIMPEESGGSLQLQLHHVGISGFTRAVLFADPAPLSGPRGQKFPARPSTHPNPRKPAGAQPGESCS